MKEFEALSNSYLALGAGGLALIVLIWLLVYLVIKINPILQGLKAENEVNKEIIKNNTGAIKEISRSNENVASALKLLEASFSNFGKLLERHDERQELMAKDILIIGEKINNLDANRKA